MPQTAWADNECGVGTEVTCTPSGNTYANGIFYVSGGDQIIHLQNGVVVDALDPNIGLLALTGGATNIVTIDGPTGVSITTEGDSDFGALLATNSGALTANIASVTTHGVGATGVDGSSADGAVKLTLGMVKTTGAGSDGVVVLTNTGAITINAGTVTTTGNGVSAQSDTAAIGVTVGNVTTTGAGAAGVTSSSNGAKGAITIVNTGLVQTSGSGAVGISANSPTAGVTITSNQVKTTGDGATGITGASTFGTVNITSTSVQTSGKNADGISVTTPFAFFPTQTATIVSGTVTTTGDNSAGIRVNTPGAASITSSGNVTTTGAAAPGITATSTGGATTVNVTGGAISSAKDVGLSLSGQTSTAVIGSKASVSGATAGINLVSTTGSTLTNNGSVASSGGFAVQASGGPATVNNAGTITGAVSLTAGADTFNNSGTFAALKNSDFGAGADVFNNTGTVSVLPTATTAGSVTFTGLETFSNKGTVSLANGHAGDTLNLPGTFNGGTGSALALDFAGGFTPLADTLVVTGATTGSTAVTLNNTNGGLLTNNLVIVRGGAGSSSGAFTLAPGSTNLGYVGYQVVYDPTANTYAVVGAPNAAVYETLKVEELVSNFSRYSSDAWSSHMAQSRDAHWAGAGIDGIRGWGQFFGGAQDRQSGRSVTNFGVTQAFNTSYDTNYYGFQGGIDGVRGPLTLGLTAGYAGADQHFLATGDKTFIQGYNVGGYAGVVMGGLFVNALVKYNGDKIQMGSILPVSVTNLSAHTYSGVVEAGYRFGGESFFVEPIASIDYQRTTLDNFGAFNSTFNFRNYDSELGKAGVRFGGRMGTFGGATVAPYFAILAEHEYRGQNGFTFSNGGFALNYADDRRGTFGHATAGLNLISARGVDGYLQGDIDFARGTGGGGARVGIRFAF